MNHNRFLPSLSRGNTVAAEASDMLAGDHRRQRRGSVQPAVCARCSRFEADLTDTTDNLSATDAELKASRQVISLLQRQLELFQVEKEGLEKLIVSQWNKPQANKTPDDGLNHAGPVADLKHQDPGRDEDTSVGDLLGLESELNEVTANSGDSLSSPDDTKKRLLKLIKTQLYTKDEAIVKLKSSLKEAQNEKEQLNLQVHTLEEDLAKMRTESSLLRENLALRDQTIISLSNELFEQSSDSATQSSNHTRRQSSAELLVSHQTAQQLRQASAHQNKTIHKLSDTLEAYKKTNELLSQNVLKLTSRCSLLERREMESKSQAQELEARCCQIQSKLLSLLKEIEQSTSSNSDEIEGDTIDKQQQQSTTTTTTTTQGGEFIHSEPVKLLIKRLLEDKSLDIPLSWKEGNKSRTKKVDQVDNSKLECDELGFYIVAAGGVNQEPKSSEGSPQRGIQTSPTSRANFARLRRAPRLARGMSEGGSGVFSSSQLNPVDEETDEGPNAEIETGAEARNQSVDSTKTDEAKWRLGWDEFIKDFDKVNLVKSKEFKDLLRCGVPQEYRCKIWKALVDLRVGKERQARGPDYFQGLTEPTAPSSTMAKSAVTSSPGQSAAPKQPRNILVPSNPAWKQIELDLLRTLPNNKYFETIDSPGTVRLRRVLIAFAAHKPEVGYCQGMNRLAAVALLVLPEEEAFWCLVAIVEHIMPVGYYNDLWLAQVDSNVVMDFVGVLMPRLADHFRHYEIELSLFAWFLTIFVDGTPPALFLRLWDCFLYEGDKIMFRVALALLMMHEKELLELDSSVAVNSFLRATVNQSTIDLDSFFKVAFEYVNPLPGRSLRAKREHHFQSMRASIKSFASGGGGDTSIKSATTQGGHPPESGNKPIEDEDDDCDSLNEESSSIISI